MKRKPSVRATRRQSSGSGRDPIEPLVPRGWLISVMMEEFEIYMQLELAQARILELEAQLSKKPVVRRSK